MAPREVTDRVVYLLGAGFSAGLGLPVTATFLDRARNLRDQEADGSSRLAEVIEQIEALSRIKSFFRSNLFNIEEALSILEIDQLAAQTLPPDHLRTFIQQVIKSTTPPIPKPGAWQRPKDGQPLLKAAVGGDEKWYRYAAFAIGLFGRRVSLVPQTSYLQCEEDAAASASYSVISLNYDRILESASELTSEHPFGRGSPIRFDVASCGSAPSDAVPLVKLHGSVDQEILVPPTWQKTLHPEVKELWRRAHTLLRGAHHLRIIGYSLPPTDGYVPYLLKAGLRHARNLKSIHVLCLDNANEAGIERRYAELISPDFPHYRFRNADVLSYLESIVSRIEAGAGFEYGHSVFFSP